jgi:hypothetical protein
LLYIKILLYICILFCILGPLNNKEEFIGLAALPLVKKPALQNQKRGRPGEKDQVSKIKEGGDLVKKTRGETWGKRPGLQNKKRGRAGRSAGVKPQGGAHPRKGVAF